MSNMFPTHPRNYNATAVANTAVTIALPNPSVGRQWAISGIEWSYDGDPTGGLLTITDADGNLQFAVNITTGGPGFFEWGANSKEFGSGLGVDIVLAAGGAGIVGRLNVRACVVPLS